MDATVNDFFKEIKELVTKSEPKVQEEVWHECFDELTGYSYFWNTQTDEVTWVPPKSYKRAENNPKKNTTEAVVEKDKKVEMFVPPTTENVPQCSMPEANVYSIQDTMKESEPVKKQPIGRKHAAKKPVLKRPFRKSEDSDDEKIELISEYAANSDSDNDDKNSQPPLDQHKSTESPLALSLLGKDSPTILLDQNPKMSTSLMPKQSDSQTDEEDDDDDLDILAKIQQRARELKKMGGEVPSSVKQIIKKTEVIETPKKSSASGFSLVAGYNSESESDPEIQEAPPVRPIFPVACLPISPVVETSHSTLFPITKPIDVKDFISYEPPSDEVVKETKTKKVESSDFDSKAFQRKRRIGISLVNNVKRPKEDVIPGTDFVGLGFKSENVDNDDIKTTNEDAPVAYPGFQKGGVMFVKSDVLNSTASQETGRTKETDCRLNKKQAEDDYTILREKLLFLGEGRDVVLPVQVMLIQAETLFQAMKEGGLNISYLRKWLSETCSDLVKLEREAAPEGWLLQWDRSHKRYFYQNQTTGVNQWRYPEPDVTRCDDAMDISTTPPPMDVKDEPAVFGPLLPSDPPLPPTPPKIRSPTPPPPPKITMATATIDLPILPAKPQPSEVIILHPVLPGFDSGQPLPPGVDLITSVSNKNLEEVPQKPTDTLITALDSFYSEIAEVSENTNSLSPVSAQIPETPSETSMDVANPQPNSEPIRKKKKKVKLAQGLTMKKKGVSQLVEKWKNVQKSYGD